MWEDEDEEEEEEEEEGEEVGAEAAASARRKRSATWSLPVRWEARRSVARREAKARPCTSTLFWASVSPMEEASVEESSEAEWVGKEPAGVEEWAGQGMIWGRRDFRREVKKREERKDRYNKRGSGRR